MSTADDIKARLDMVDVVFDYVPELKRSGKNYHARCPFHQEQTPSFVVFPDRQTWRCFGACAAGGDIFSFVMKADGLDFSAALRSLAKRAGVTLEERRETTQAESPLYSVNDVAQQFFKDTIIANRGAQARAYAEERGLSEEAVARFGLGYAPSTGEELLHRLVSLGFDEELVVQAGLAVAVENGLARDMFRGRLMFPLRDVNGRIIGFAGRSLDGTNPKYLNTPQTPVFDKGRLLYGLDRAKEAIAAEGTVVVVEGYTDVIAAHEQGYRNVVASMGTALTDQQVAILKGRASSIVLALDADAAGQEAMLRSLRTSWSLVGATIASGNRRTEVRGRPEDIDTLRIVLITGGKDPDELIRTDPSQWQRLLTTAVPAVEFLIDAETARIDVSTAQGKAIAVEQLLPLIFAIPNWADQDRYFQRLADKIGVPVGALKATVGRNRPSQRAQAAPKRLPPRVDSVESVFAIAESDPLEERVLALIAQDPDLLERVLEPALEHFGRPENRAVLAAIQACGTIEGALTELDGQLADRLTRLSQEALPPADRRQRVAEWEACLRRLEERYLRELKAQESAAFVVDAAEGAPIDLEYMEAVNRQALETNQRLRDIFASGAS